MSEDDTFQAALERALVRPDVLAKMDQFQAFARDFTTVIEEWLESVKPAVMQLGAWFEQTIQEPYRQAGAPYGDTPEAAVRWFREQTGEIAE